jgi:hypothetical protein
MRHLLTLTMLAAALQGCGSRSASESGNVSHVHFITFGPGTFGLVKKVKQPTIVACTSGISSGEQAAWDDKIKSTVLKWVKPQRAFTGVELTQQVEIRPDSQSGCDFEVRVQAGTWANTSIGARPVIRMDSSGYFASYNVLLHEMGHAFALSDTYQGASGDCKPGQPQSVMCNTSFDDLQTDDIAGLKEVYKNAFPSDQPGTGGTNPPVTPVTPTNPTVLPYKLYAALGAQIGAADGYQIHASLVGAPAGQETGTLAFCNGSASVCSAAGARWIDMTRGQVRGDVALWSLNSGTVLAEGLSLTLRYTNAQGVATQSVQFKRR